MRRRESMGRTDLIYAMLCMAYKKHEIVPKPLSTHIIFYVFTWNLFGSAYAAFLMFSFQIQFVLLNELFIFILHFFCLNARLFLVFGKISINHSSDLEIENHEIYERKHQSRLRYRSYFSEFGLQNGNRISIGVHRVFLVAPISLFLNCWLKSVKKISKSLL